MSSIIMVLPADSINTHFSEARIIKFSKAKNITVSFINRTGVDGRVTLLLRK